MGLIRFLLISFLLISNQLYSQDFSEEELRNRQNLFKDALNVGYTYWWPQSGPFIGNCGQKYSLVFLGEIKKIEPPAEDSTRLYTSQRGFISIDRVLTVRPLKRHPFEKQTIFTSDCFYEQNLNEGDRVMVFCYEYEDDYSIPGGSSIIRIEGKKDPLVKSIMKYIKSGENALKIKADLPLWKRYGFGDELEQLIHCAQVVKKAK